jgi:hypothetical protein
LRLSWSHLTPEFDFDLLAATLARIRQFGY